LDPKAKLEKQLKYADNKGISYAIIVGPEEAQSEQVVLKNLSKRTQEKISLIDLLTKLSN
jgi:histidyl-tRNA synthetase